MQVNVNREGREGRRSVLYRLCCCWKPEAVGILTEGKIRVPERVVQKRLAQVLRQEVLIRCALLSERAF